jgi:hypothetical protein
MIRTKRTVLKLSALLSGILMVSACTKHEPEEAPRPARAGKAVDPVQTAAHLVSIRAAAAVGDEQAVRDHMGAMQEDFRKAIKLADPSRVVDREGARQAARQVDGVRSVAWIDHENLFVIVSSNEARNYGTIDRICLALEPLGDTLGVVVSLQSGAATNGDELAVLTRNCQLEPGDRALLSRRRDIDVVDPEIRRQHRANQSLFEQDADDLVRQEDSLRALEASTRLVDD